MGFAREWPPAVDAKFSTPGARRVVSGSAFSPAALAEPTQGFPRRARLTSPAEFGLVLKEAQIRRGFGVLRLACRKNAMHFPRLGLIVGKRAVPKASQRNRIKRVIRDHFRRHRHELEGYDVVIQVTGGAENAELRARLRAAFQLIEKH